MALNFKTMKEGFMFDDTPRGLLEALLIGGGMVAALSFAPTLIFALAGVGYALKAQDKARRKKLHNSLDYLKRHNYVRVVSKSEKGERKVRVELTALGKRRATEVHAKRLLLQNIERPKMWDKHWRIIMFDISADERAKRSAFRALIRRLGAVMLQKSVWIHPFDCSEQIGLLRDFFHLSDNELRVITAESIGDDVELRKHFSL